MTHPNNRITESIALQDNYKLLFDKTPISIVLIDSNSQIVDINSATEKLFGFKRNDLIGFKIAELYALPSPNKISINKVFDQLLKGGIFGPADIQIYDKHKNLIWVNIIASKIEIEKKIYIQVLTQDISQRKTLEQEVQESEEKYRLLFENMNAGFAYHEVVVNEDNKPIDYRYIEANNQFEKMTGLKVSDIIGKTVTEILPGTENDPADWIGKFGNVGLTGVPLTVEDYSEAIDRWFKVSGYSPKKGFFAVTFNDITDRKRAEQKLKESEERYRNLAESLPEVIFEIDLSFTITYTNSIASKVFGYTSKEFKEGMTIFDFIISYITFF